MSAEAALLLSPGASFLPMVQAYHPTTFLERGVAVPFTTPSLVGARARPADRGGLEIVVPNPAGGRGVYILPWVGVCQLCRPTVHDAMLNQRVGALRSVTPSSIHQIARGIAAEGMAGRNAATTAGIAAESDQQDRLVTNFNLLLALIAQIEPGALQELPDDGDSGEAPQGPRPWAGELQLRARRAVARIGPKLGRTSDAVAETLEELARVFAGIGTPDQKPVPRIVRLLAALGRLHADMLDWAKTHAGDSAAQASMIATVAELTITCAERTLADAHDLTRDMAAMLRAWSAGAAELAARIARPEWLLDGWEQICLMWQGADGEAARGGALNEMAQLLPVLPRETSDWVGKKIETDVVGRFRRTVRQNEDWRTGLTLERIARNEALRALRV